MLGPSRGVEHMQRGGGRLRGRRRRRERGSERSAWQIGSTGHSREPTAELGDALYDDIILGAGP